MKEYTEYKRRELWSIEFEQFTENDRIISEYYYIDENEGDLIVNFTPAVFGLGLVLRLPSVGKKNLSSTSTISVYETVCKYSSPS